MNKISKVKGYSKRMEEFWDETRRKPMADTLGLAIKHNVLSIYDIAEASENWADFKKMAKEAGYSDKQIMKAKKEIEKLKKAEAMAKLKAKEDAKKAEAAAKLKAKKIAPVKAKAVATKSAKPTKAAKPTKVKTLAKVATKIVKKLVSKPKKKAAGRKR